MRIQSVLLTATMALLSAAPALAHPKLLSATPRPNSVIAAPSRLQLSFSEKLMARFSKVDLVMTAMPGMAMKGPMKMAALKTGLTPDGKTVVVPLAKRLAAGTYKLTYHVVSQDTHRIGGGYAFRVK